MATVTAAQIARLRRMVDESTFATYDDDAITDYIESYPLLDARGEVPFTWDTSTSPPTKVDNTVWIGVWDLNAAASAIWEEKAAVLAQDYDFRASDNSYERSQKYEQAMKQARYYRSKRAPRTITARMEPPIRSTTARTWIGNQAEDND